MLWEIWWILYAVQNKLEFYTVFLSDSYIDTTKKEKAFRKKISVHSFFYETNNAVRLNTFLFMWVYKVETEWWIH